MQEQRPSAGGGGPKGRRWVEECASPDAGLGHSLGYLNVALKLSLRVGLPLSYRPALLRKSTGTGLPWHAKQAVRRLLGRPPMESHGIGDALDTLLRPGHVFDSYSRMDWRRPYRARTVRLPSPVIGGVTLDQDDDVVYAPLEAAVRACPDPAVAFQLPRNHPCDGEYAATRSWFSERYWQARALRPSSPPAPASPKHIRVAVQVRRGDLLPGRPFANIGDRMLPDSWYLAAIDMIRKRSGLPIQVLVLTQGVDGAYLDQTGTARRWAEYPELQDTELTVRLEGGLLEDFDSMMDSDILVGSRSGLPHFAAMLREGASIVPRMWHSYRGAPGAFEVDGDAMDEAVTGAVERLRSRA